MSIDHGKVLVACRRKLEAYRDAYGLEYVGGQELSSLLADIDRALAQPAEAVEGPLPPEAVEVFPSALNGGTALPGDWAIPRAPGINRIVDARMAYGWNECRKEMRRRLTLAAGDDVTDAAQGAVVYQCGFCGMPSHDPRPLPPMTVETLAIATVRAVIAGVKDNALDGRKAVQMLESAICMAPYTHPQAAPAQGDGGNHKLDTDTHVFFYEQDFYVLSNFSAFTLQWKGRRFDTSEAAYHWEKFNGTCPEVQDMILEAPSAHAAFKLAESQKCFRRADWDDVKLDVMREILRAKADQHEYVRRKLLATGDRTLVEDSWRDDFWGWGPNRNGHNWLGRLWMEVRAELAAAPSQEGES